MNKFKLLSVVGLMVFAGCASTSAPTDNTPTKAPADIKTEVSPAAMEEEKAMSEDPMFPVGAKVYGNRVGDQWLPGKIVSVKNGVYTVEYDDKYDSNTELSKDKIAPMPTSKANVEVGDVVIVKWTSTWWQATVTDVDGSEVSVLYSDKTTGKVKDTEITRPADGSWDNRKDSSAMMEDEEDDMDKDSNQPEPVATAAEPFPVGMTVLGNWNDGEAWYPGKVSKSENGKYSLKYEDGSSEDGMSINELAYFPGGPQDVKVGDSVIAEWRPATWWLAEVTGVEGTTLKLLYSDNTTGEVENDKVTVPGRQ